MRKSNYSYTEQTEKNIFTIGKLYIYVKKGHIFFLTIHHCILL